MIVTGPLRALALPIGQAVMLPTAEFAISLMKARRFILVRLKNENSLISHRRSGVSSSRIVLSHETGYS